MYLRHFRKAKNLRRFVQRLLRAILLALTNRERFIARFRQEIVKPSTNEFKLLRKAYFLIVPRSPSSRSAQKDRNQDRFLLVYDLSCCSITFDFLRVLYFAEWLRVKFRKEHLDILFVTVPNVEDCLEENYVKAVGTENIYWRITNVLFPLTRLIKSVQRRYIVDEQEAFEIVNSYDNVHPKNYSQSNPMTSDVNFAAEGVRFSDSLFISDSAREFVESYFPLSDPRPIVTITLRTYGYIQARNSNIVAWVEFASELDPAKYRVVFIPDASAQGIKTIDKLKEFDVFDAACWNIELRAALYARSWLNMGVGGGPLGISCLLDTSYTIQIDRSNACPDDYVENIIRWGLQPGVSPDDFSDKSFYILGEDNKETINRLFDQIPRN